MYDKTNDSSLIRQPAFYVMFKNQNIAYPKENSFQKWFNGQE